MAGNQFTSYFSGLDNSPIQAFDFTFNFGDEHPLLHDSRLAYPGVFSTPISGNFEFIGTKHPPFWKSLVSLIAICAIFSLGFYYLLGDFKSEMATYISVDSVKSEIALSQTLLKKNLISATTISEPKKEKVAPGQQEKKGTSVVAKIEQEEKTVNQTQLVTPHAEPEQTHVSKNYFPVIVSPKVEDFKTHSLTEAKRIAVNTGRYTFIKFGAEWCVTCKLMESTALKNRSVMAMLDSKYVVLSVDIDEPSGYKIKEEFYVDKLPTLIILDEMGNEIRRQIGALGTSGLIDMLSQTAEYIHLNDETITAHVFEEKNMVRKK